MKPKPFKKAVDRQLKASEALSEVFDDSTAGEMMDRMTDSPAETIVPTSPLETNEPMAQNLEEKEKIERLRDNYIMWYELNYPNIDDAAQRVDATYKFKPDGAHAVTELDFGFAPITHLPPLLQSIEGYLDLNGTQIKSLEQLPKKINGHLHIRGISATSIPPDLTITGAVFVTEKQDKLKESAQAAGYTVITS